MMPVSVRQVIEAWHKMCERAQSVEDIEELTIVLGRAKQFLITQEGQQFYIMLQVKALIPLEVGRENKKS